jgi:hypothetical protein
MNDRRLNMPKRILAVLDEGLVDRFCNGTASEHHDAEQELQSRLRRIRDLQVNEQPIEAKVTQADRYGAEFNGLKLSMSGVRSILELQEAAHVSKDAQIVQIEFHPATTVTLVHVGTAVHHVSMQSGETTGGLRE